MDRQRIKGGGAVGEVKSDMVAGPGEGGGKGGLNRYKLVRVPERRKTPLLPYRTNYVLRPQEVPIEVRADVGSDPRNSEVNDDRDGCPMTGSGSGGDSTGIGGGKDWASSGRITGEMLKFRKRKMDGQRTQDGSYFLWMKQFRRKPNGSKMGDVAWGYQDA